MEFHEAASGARLHANYFRPGGVSKDLPAGLEERIAAWAETFPKFIDDLEELLTGNRIWKQRTVDIGVMCRRAGAGLGIHRAMHLRAAACRGTCAGRSRTTNTPRWTSRSRSAATATATTAISMRICRDAREREDHQAGLAKMKPGPVKVQDHKFTPAARAPR